MVLSLAVAALLLIEPSDVFEEWALVRTAPLRETVSARATYHRGPGDAALLPAAVQGPERPVAFASGGARALPVTAGPRGWQCALPAGDRESVRVTARVTRATDLPRLFRVRWPRVRPDAAPARRVALVPRAWLDGSPAGWTCPDEPVDEVPCVSYARAPGAVLTRVDPPPSPRGAIALAFVLAGASFTAAAYASGRRAERALAGAGGATVALATCLALVGAHMASWGGAACVTIPLGVAVGAVAPRSRWGRVAGALALVTVPLAAVFGAPAPWVLALAAGLAVAVLAGALAGDGSAVAR